MVQQLMSVYPNLQEKAAIAAAERLMVQTMARYDPSHDRYHGESTRKVPADIDIQSQLSAFARPLSLLPDPSQ